MVGCRGWRMPGTEEPRCRSVAIDKAKVESLHRSVDIVLEALDEMLAYPTRHELASENALASIDSLRNELSIFHEVVRRVERHGEA